jgi:hypothetical protein
MEELPILIVFDIDETLIQFIPQKAYHYWEETSEENKQILKEKCGVIDIPKNKHLIIFRAGLKEFLEEVKRNKRIHIALWTYSEREYAEDMGGFITKYFGFEKNPFVFQYGTEDVKDHSQPKSLKQIWDNPKFGNKYNKFNTFLVDDRKANICHGINMNNGIIIQAFAPYGETKERSPLTQASLEKAINDDVLENLLKISKNILKDIDGCSEEEIEEALKVESVFAPKCMKRKKLTDYLKEYEYEDDTVKICSIGDVEHAGADFKGGKKVQHKNINQKRKTQHKKKTHKRKTQHKRKTHHKKKTHRRHK